MNRASSRGVSILIPAYNASATIGATLISTFLTRPRLSEVIIFIDGGETNSRVLSWLEARGLVRVFRPGHRSGVAKAMNFMISQAKYEIVARVDADDIPLPWRYGKAIRLIKKDRADVVFSNAILFGNGIKFFPFLPQFPFPIRADLAPYFLQLANPFVQSTMIARKKVLQESGGYQEATAEDYELFLRLASQQIRLKRTGMFGVLYRVHAGQLSGQPDFQSKVDNDPLVQASKKRLQLRLQLDDETPNQENLEFQIQELLESRSLGFFVRRKLLSPIATVLLRISGLRDRLK